MNRMVFLFFFILTNLAIAQQDIKLVFAYDTQKMSATTIFKKLKNEPSFTSNNEALMYTLYEHIQRCITPYNEDALNDVPITREEYDQGKFPAATHWLFFLVQMQEDAHHYYLKIYVKLLYKKSGQQQLFRRSATVKKAQNREQVIARLGREIANKILTSFGFPPKQEKKSAIDKLNTEIAKVVQSIAEEYQGQALIIGPILHYRAGIGGPFAAKLSELLEKNIESQDNLTLIRTRGLDIEGEDYVVSAKYAESSQRIKLVFYLKDSQSKELKKWPRIIKNIKLHELPDFLPENYGTVKKHLNNSNQGAKKLSVTVTTKKGKVNAIYRHRELLQLQVKASHDCYLQMFYRQTNGDVIQIFPNNFRPNNRIKGGKIYNIPDANYRFKFRINAKKSKGMEVVRVVASLKPLADLSGKSLNYHGLRGIDIEGEETLSGYGQESDIAEDICSVLVSE